MGRGVQEHPRPTVKPHVVRIVIVQKILENAGLVQSTKHDSLVTLSRNSIVFPSASRTQGETGNKNEVGYPTDNGPLIRVVRQKEPAERPVKKGNSCPNGGHN